MTTKDETKPDVLVDTSKAVRLGTKTGSLHARVAAAANNPQAAIAVGGVVTSSRFVNFARVFILPDTSGSMTTRYGTKTASDLSKDAIAAYLRDSNPILHAVGIASFPEAVYVVPTQDYNSITSACAELSPIGSTPLADAFGYILEEEKFTHAVIISDGDADVPDDCIALAHNYKAKAITVDCVHIGSSKGGEVMLKQIAEITGGIYIKFTDVTSFAKNFSFLTPAKRTQLLTSANPIALLGASEVKL